MLQFLDEIEEHFKQNYPREGCGLLAVVKGELQWFPCTNVAEHEDDFILDSTEYLNISRKSDIVGICLLYTSPSPRDLSTSRMPSSA